MNIYTNVKEDILKVIAEIAQEINVEAITVEAPKDEAHGDLSTNAAMILASILKTNPRQVATQIAEKLSSIDYIEKVDIAGPGFINLKLQPYVWQNIVKIILEQKQNFGISNIGNGQKINVEYVSANPTGPMHIGHARGAVYGDALASVLKQCGYDVTKEYYINDAGGQIDVLCKSAYLRYVQAATGKEVAIPEGLYPGDYLVPVGQKLYEKFGKELLDNEEAAIGQIKDFVLEQMMSLIETSLSELGIKHDIFFSEKTLHASGKITEAVELLKKKDLIYEGQLEAPKGQVDEDWDNRTQLLFKSTEFGDDQDRALTKANGDWAYFAADIGYAYDKMQRGFDTQLLVLGADHSGYIKRMQAIVKALSDSKVKSDIKICQLVNFMLNGEPVKMSKRAGTFTTVDDVVKEVGGDIVRFVMLTRKNDATMDFDLVKVKEQSKDNPVFYVQYAYVRCNSILKNAFASDSSLEESYNKGQFDVTKLSSNNELNIIKLLASWPKTLELSAIHAEPHRIAFYLQKLAAEFHSLWNFGKENPEFRFVLENDRDLTLARLALAGSVMNIISAGLSVIGVKPVEKM